MLTSAYEKHLQVCPKIIQSCPLKRQVVTGKSSSFTMVHLNSGGITCVVCQVFQFSVWLVCYPASITALSSNVLKSGGWVEGACQCCG